MNRVALPLALPVPDVEPRARAIGQEVGTRDVVVDAEHLEHARRERRLLDAGPLPDLHREQRERRAIGRFLGAVGARDRHGRDHQTGEEHQDAFEHRIPSKRRRPQAAPAWPAGADRARNAG